VAQTNGIDGWFQEYLARVVSAADRRSPKDSSEARCFEWK
jgi:hypothetical protein